MRTRLMAALAATMALVMAPLAAPGAWAQPLAGGSELGISYQLTTNAGEGSGRVGGVGFHYDAPRFGPVTLAANATFSNQHRAGGQQSVYFGAGPGVRLSFSESGAFFGHFLLGAEVGWAKGPGSRRTATDFQPRGGIGVSYRVAGNLRLRAGLDFDSHTHVLMGAGLRF